MAHAQAIARASQRGLHVATGPARTPGRGPGVVVTAPAPRLGAAVVRRAAADHPCPLDRQAPSVGGEREVSPVVALRKAAGVKQIARPPLRLEGAVVRSGL